MVSRTARATLWAVSALPAVVSAFNNQTSSYPDVEAMRAQLALMGDRPADCPPWCASSSHPPKSWLLANPALAAASTACSRPLLVANMPSATLSTASVLVLMDLEAPTV